MKMKKLLLSSLLLLVVQMAMAQATRKFGGKVLDESGQPVVGANIYFPTLQKGTVTDVEGLFGFEGLPAGSLKVRFSSIGFLTKEQDIDLTVGDVSGFVVTLGEQSLFLEDIVVTGVTNAQSKLESSVSISTVRTEEIQKAAPRTTAEIFRSIPGIRAEASGGDGNTNITVRGVPLSTGGSKYLQLQEDGLPVFQFGDIAFATSDIFLRADQTVGRIEAIRGGSASTMATNSPAGIINFISKTGAIEGGSLTTSMGIDYQNFRTDFNYGAPINKGLYFHVGGFYRTGEGPRKAGYNANNGGQFKANLTKEFEKGYARIYLKVLDDRAAAYMPAPVEVSGTNDKPTYRSLANFNVQRGSLLSPELLETFALDGNNSVLRTNVSDGMRAASKSVGVELSFDLGNDWKFESRGKAAFNSGSFVAPFPALAGSRGTVLPQIGTAIGQDLANATLSYAVGGGTYTGNEVMAIHMFNTRLNNFNNYMNDLQLKKKIGNTNLTFGLYKSIQQINMDWLFTSHLTTLEGEHPRALNITTASGTNLSNRGIYAYSAALWGNFKRQMDLHYDITAPYFAAGSKLSEKLSVDGSIRYDLGRVRGSYTGNVQKPHDMNGDGVISPNEQSVSAFNYAAAAPVNYKFDYVSYSVGFNYLITNGSAVFARYSSGGSARADRLVGTPNILADGSARGTFDRLDQAELGYKLSHKIGSFFVTGFYARTKENGDYEITSGRIIQNSYRAYGVEFESVVYPVKGLSLRSTFTYTHARILDGAAEGKTPRRQAPWIYAVTPTYEKGGFAFGFSAIGTTRAYTQNTNELVMPGYVYINPFINYQINDSMRASLNANNIFNVMGFTEAEEAAIVNGTTNVIRARAITGRTISASLTFSF